MKLGLFSVMIFTLSLGVHAQSKVLKGGQVAVSTSKVYGKAVEVLVMAKLTLVIAQ